MFEKIIEKSKEIYDLDFVKSINNNRNGVGLTLEKLLGKNEDNFSYPDYEGIEIKSQRGMSKNDITLFSCTPSGKVYPEIERIRENYGYYDYTPNNMKVLNAEFCNDKNNLISNRYFFNLKICEKEGILRLFVYDINYKLIDDESYWFLEDLKEKFEIKMRYLAMFIAKSKIERGDEYFKYYRLECYEYENFNKFIDLLNKNVVKVVITTSQFAYGPSKGLKRANCYFQISRFDLPKLFKLVCVKDWVGENHF